MELRRVPRLMMALMKSLQTPQRIGVLILLLVCVLSVGWEHGVVETPRFMPRRSRAGAPVYVPRGAVPDAPFSGTVFLLPGYGEDNPTSKFNYAYKFDFYLRCFVFGAFPNFKLITSTDAVANEAQPGDIVVVIARGNGVVKEIPTLITQRTDRQIPKDVRIGAYHTADERLTASVDWYKSADFVLRNYYREDAPFSKFVPIGPKMPDDCDVDQCSCGSRLLPEAPDRQHLFHLSVSLRKSRKALVDLIGKDPEFEQLGYVKISSEFGGDGPHAKDEYLEEMIQSKFVFAPCGNVVETHRMWESLAMGSIPLVENCTDTQQWWPFQNLVFDSFPLAIDFLRNAENSSVEVRYLQHRTQQTWNAYAAALATDVSRYVLNGL